MDKCKHLIIGAGPAALAAAQAIRNISKTAEITLINREELPLIHRQCYRIYLAENLLKVVYLKKGTNL